MTHTFKKTQNNTEIFIKAYVFLALCLLYISFSMVLTKGTFPTTLTAYYNYFLDAIFHGHIYIASPYHYDLSLFHGKWYLNWAPAPILFILPFYIIGGLKASDVLYTLFAGIVNIILFYLVLQECKKYFYKSLSLFSEIFILVSFAISSPNFFLSLTGQIWGTEQIIATMYLLVSYFFYFKFLNNKNICVFIASVLFFNLAWFSRYVILFNGIMFLFPFFVLKSNKKLKEQVFLVLTCITAFFFIIFFSYNYAKFHNPFETGLRYHKGNIRYHAAIEKDMLFSPIYVPHNMYYFFLNIPRFSLHRPYVLPDKEGNSIFFIYPCIVLLFYIPKKILSQKDTNVFLQLVGIVIFATFSFLLFYFATGWVQFGMRYFLDIVPLIYVSLIFVIEDVPLLITVPMLLYGIFINIFGIVSTFS